MHSSNFLNFLLVVALMILHKRSVLADDSSGFHGNERAALMALKTTFNSSVLNSNWTGLMCYMNDPPHWQGIQCLNGRVTAIILENMGLTGEINTYAISNLTELATLSFRNNSISGNLMHFTNNKKLRNIDLSSNDFHGLIPSSLLTLVSVESLQLQDNNLIGPILAFNQPSLKTFNVSYNNLSGPIPETATLQRFNLSSYVGNVDLCGPPSTTVCISRDSVSESNSTENPGKKSHSFPLFTAVLVVVDVLVIVIILFLFIIYFKKYKNLKREMKANNLLPKDDEHDSKIVDRASGIRTPEAHRGKLVFVDNQEMRFELDDLLKASAEGLGKGNFGNCYKAMLEVGGAIVVKRLRDLKPLSSEEFVRQVKAIADQKHPNLLPLIAYYHSKEEKLLLYRFAEHGNVFNRLHGGRKTRERVPFRWSSRLSVARNVARALVHLHAHTKSQTTAPHGNLKSTNVLLTANDEPLVSDYGLCSLIATPVAAQCMVAYKTPEYQSQKRITKKSDVWSYGCFLLELLTGKISAHSAPAGTNGVDLCSWVHRAVREEWTAEIFDSEIAVQRGANQGMLRLMQIAMRCCDRAMDKRPDMGQVAAEVEEIKVAVGSSEEEDGYYSNSNSSFDQSLTDDTMSGSLSMAVVDQQR